MAFVDSNYCFSYVNNSFEQLFGLGRECIEGRTMDDMLGADTFENTIKPCFDRALAGETCHSRAWIAARNNADTRFMETRYTPYFENDQVLGVIVVARDDTDRKLSESALRDNETKYRLLAERVSDVIRDTETAVREKDAKYRLLVEHVSDVIWTMDRDLAFTFFSPSVERLLGYTPEEMLALDLSAWMAPDSLRMARERMDRWRRVWRTGDAQRVSGPIVYELVTKAGDHIWAEVTTTEISDTRGVCTGLLGVTHDVTERVLFERRREETERLLRHDLKTPLSGVISMPEVLLGSSALSDGERHLLKVIQHAGQKMLRLIDAGQSLHTLEEGTYRLSPQEIDLGRELTRIATEQADACRRKNVSIKITLGGVAISMTTLIPIDGDPNLLPFLFSNLLQNAVEASPEGGEITVAITHGETVTVAIHNMGAVPDPIRTNFFEKYVTHGKKTGTGLGAYSALLIARGHGGDITMRTSEEKGTTVTVTLPLEHDVPVFRT